MVVKQGHEPQAKIQWMFLGEQPQLPPVLQSRMDGSFGKVVTWVEAEGVRVCVGLGKAEELTGPKLQQAAAKAAKEMKAQQQLSFEVPLAPLSRVLGEQAAFYLVLGMELALYEYAGVRRETARPKKEYTLLLDEAAPEELEAAQLALSLAQGVCQARDWANAPGNLLTPAIFAQEISERVQDAGCRVTVLDEAQTAALGMNTFLSVGKSSSNPAKFIIARYDGDPSSSERLALVGKGITLDTGGYCLKTRAGLEHTKGDMAGAAAVMGAICALARSKVKANVVAVVPACENKLSNTGSVPGDVVTSMSGKTVEILNTDAEGRLILADALTYAVQVEKATRLVDVATLTGSAVNTFGYSTAALLTNNDDWYAAFEKATAASGEQYWRMPAFPEYRELLNSEVADIKNVGPQYAGCIIAGMFLREFAGETPWLHLDIAGTARVDKPCFAHQVPGATGAAVTSLYFLARQMAGQQL